MGQMVVITILLQTPPSMTVIIPSLWSIPMLSKFPLRSFSCFIAVFNVLRLGHGIQLFKCDLVIIWSLSVSII